MRCLLIGGAGLIGSYLAGRLAHKGHRVTIVDSFRSSERLEEWRRPFYDFRMEQTAASAEIVRADVRDEAAMRHIAHEYRPDVVYYLAALLASESAAFPDEARAVQIGGLQSIIRYLEERASSYRMVVASSSYVYGNFVTIPAAEEHPLLPLDIYGTLKVEAETLIRTTNWQRGQWSILRPSSVYGVGDPRKRYATVAIEQAAAGRTIELSYPEFICDFSYVVDVADAFERAGVEYFVPSEIFNVTYGEAYTNQDFIRALQSVVPDATVKELTSQPIVAPIRGALDSTKARQQLNWHPHFDIRAGIIDAYQQANAALLASTARALPSAQNV